MNHRYEAKKFNLPADIPGLSAKQIEVHIGLYNGYVAHVNKLNEQLKSICSNEGDHTYAMTELNRRLGFEFNGMRMHEYYFEQLEGGATAVDSSSKFANMLQEKLGGFDGLIKGLTITALSRGIGWTVLYWDNVAQTPVMAWVSDHELGTLAGLPIIFAIDMWEHAFMVDYTPTEKAQYIEAYLNNVNWSVVSGRFI